ncbi:zinc ribbon domain-containing protein [Albidovulum sediminicola]|uniref:Zinc ribbon domain-containing protein n=1 Tax=Albidovulum sediminicola TaxID=2984331 RepID=A0ABT2Z4R0_9RHOB|nr:zinc ribbon domain-containing protein [Defluviimonas sp. WL0075]MCV2866045.1 zinc ribbon domain-containing protein [Defluviimonas sp. WL0075]
MTMVTPALALQAANDNPGGCLAANVALTGLVALLVRAEVRAIARKGAATPKAARAAQRARYLLSGLLTCGCCGAPYIIASRISYGCREAHKQACNNKVPVSRKRIEARVFAGLRKLFMAPEMIARFKAALAKAEAAQANIIAAIAEGAPFAAFKARSAELEAEIADLRDRIRQTEARIAQQALPLEAAATVYARALDQMSELLGDPDLVEEANGYLRMLIRGVTLTPDEAAPHGLAAEIVLNPSDWLPARGGSDPESADDGLRIRC